MDVVEDEHDRTLARDRLDETTHGPERLAWSGRSLFQPGQLRHAARDLLGVVLALEQRRDALERRLMRCLANDLGDRQIRGAFAVRDAAADENARPLAQGHKQLPK